MAKGCQYSKPSLKGFTHFASKGWHPRGDCTFHSLARRLPFQTKLTDHTKRERSVLCCPARPKIPRCAHQRGRATRSKTKTDPNPWIYETNCHLLVILLCQPAPFWHAVGSRFSCTNHIFAPFERRICITHVHNPFRPPRTVPFDGWLTRCKRALRPLEYELIFCCYFYYCCSLCFATSFPSQWIRNFSRE